MPPMFHCKSGQTRELSQIPCTDFCTTQPWTRARHEKLKLSAAGRIKLPICIRCMHMQSQRGNPDTNVATSTLKSGCFSISSAEGWTLGWPLFHVCVREFGGGGRFHFHRESLAERPPHAKVENPHTMQPWEIFQISMSVSRKSAQPGMEKSSKRISPKQCNDGHGRSHAKANMETHRAGTEGSAEVKARSHSPGSGIYETEDPPSRISRPRLHFSNPFFDSWVNYEPRNLYAPTQLGSDAFRHGTNTSQLMCRDYMGRAAEHAVSRAKWWS